MPHDDAILEQALAELAELSRRVADLTATVSVLAAREHSPSSLLSPRADESPVAQSPHASAACQPQAFLPPAFQSQAFQQQSLSTPASTAPGSSTAAWPPWPYWPMPPMYLPPGQPVAGPRAAPAACPAGVPSLAGVPSSACEPSSSCEPPVDPATLPVEDPPVVVRVDGHAACDLPDPVHDEVTTDAAVPETLASSSTSKPAAAKGSRKRSRQRTSRRRSSRRSRPHAADTATPTPATTAHSSDLPSTGSETRHPQRRRRLGPLLMSSTLHVVALLALAMVFVAREPEPEPLVISSGLAAEPILDDVVELDMTPPEMPEPLPEIPAEPIVPDLADLEPAGPPLESLPAAGDLPTVETVSLLESGLLTGPTTAELLAPLGAASATGNGGGGVTAGMPSAGSMFFGTPGGGASICYLCDNSRSYKPGGFETVVRELVRSIHSLKPEQSFFVVFFSDEAYPLFYPDTAHELLPATPENKQQVQQWLSGVETRTGGQGLRDAIELVESLQPASVCLLSDGDHSESLVDRLVSADLGEAVVNTFGMQNLPASRGSLTPARLQKQQQHNQNLIDIALAHGGVFTPVMMQP